MIHRFNTSNRTSYIIHSKFPVRKFLLLFFICPLFFSCQNNIDKQKEKEKIGKVDLFRERVLKLRHVGLLNSIPDKNLDSLIEVFRTDTLNGLKNLLVQSGELLQLDLNLKQQSPIQVYRKICKIIGEKFPDLKNDSLNCQYLPDETGGKDTGWVMMKQRVGKNVYSKKLYYFNDWPIDETFCKIYNTRLATEKKDYRIYLITFMCSDCVNPMDDSKIKEDINTMGIIRLSKAQADSLMPIEQLAMDPEDEFDVMSTKEVETKIKQFESTGILVKNDSAWWRVRKEEIRENTVYGMEDVYDFLDTLFCTASFDTINDYNPYEEILKSMSNISRGKFKIGAPADEVQNPSTRTVRFTLSGKVYEREEEQHGAILNPGIIDEVNDALEEQKIGGAFYTVLSRENVLLLIYLDDKNVEKAKSSGFFSEFTKGAAQDLKNRYAATPAT